MLFTNPRQIINQSNETLNKQQMNTHYDMNHYFPMLIKQPPIKRVIASNNIKEMTVENNETKKQSIGKVMIWGEPTWFLLHTLAEKIKEKDFVKLRGEILNIIFLICTNLPCPTCSDHAKIYLNNINFDSIQSKKQLKDMLFVFHNFVNKQKNYPIFDYTELEEKYSKAITINIIQNFILHFKDNHSKSIRMIANDFHRSNIIKHITIWVNKNIHSLDD